MDLPLDAQHTGGGGRGPEVTLQLLSFPDDRQRPQPDRDPHSEPSTAGI